MTACAVCIWDLLDNSSCRDLWRSSLCCSPPSLGSEGVNPGELICASLPFQRWQTQEYLGAAAQAGPQGKLNTVFEGFFLK